MFSGKSTELIRRIRRYQHAKLNCIIVKSKKDKRYSVCDVSTHDKQMIKAIPISKLNELEDLSKSVDVIGIDEGQFFPDLYDFCDRAANNGTIIIVAALDSTFERKPFNDVCNLISLAENVLKRHAVCINCGMDAAFTRRISNERKIELIGGSEIYEPVCRGCYLLVHN